MFTVHAHSLWLIVVIVGGNMLFAAVGVLAARRFKATNQAKSHHQVAGYFLGVVGILYSLVLGLLIANLQGKFDRAAVEAQVESNSCSDLWNFTRGLPQAERHRMRLSIKNFYTAAQNESWDKTAISGKEIRGAVFYSKMWQELMSYQPDGERENSCYQSCLSAMQDLSDARTYRTSFGNHTLPPIVWWMLVIGGALIVVFTYMFFVQTLATQLLITSCVAGIIALNLFLVNTFEHPYRRDLNLQSQTFSFNPNIFNDDSADKMLPENHK